MIKFAPKRDYVVSSKSAASKATAYFRGRKKRPHFLRGGLSPNLHILVIFIDSLRPLWWRSFWFLLKKFLKFDFSTKSCKNFMNGYTFLVLFFARKNYDNAGRISSTPILFCDYYIWVVPLSSMISPGARRVCPMQCSHNSVSWALSSSLYS